MGAGRTRHHTIIIPQGGFPYDRPDAYARSNPFRIHRAARLRVARTGRRGRGRAHGRARSKLSRDGRERDGPRYAGRHDALTTLVAACETQRRALLALIEADAAGFLPMQRAYAIPKTDPDRAARLAAAARTACQAPLAMLAHCAQAALLLPAALEMASPLLRSDIGCAAALCRAAAEAAAMNVFVNTGLLAPDDRAETEARAEHLRATVAQSCAQTVDAVFAALRGEG